MANSWIMVNFPFPLVCTQPFSKHHVVKPSTGINHGALILFTMDCLWRLRLNWGIQICPNFCRPRHALQLDLQSQVSPTWRHSCCLYSVHGWGGLSHLTVLLQLWWKVVWQCDLVIPPSQSLFYCCKSCGSSVIKWPSWIPLENHGAHVPSICTNMQMSCSYWYFAIHATCMMNMIPGK